MNNEKRQSQSTLLYIWVALSILLALYLRVHAVLHTEVISPIRADASDYYSYAYNLRHSGIYSRSIPVNRDGSPKALKPDALRSPGYPIFLTAFVNSSPNPAILTNITITQAIISTLTVFLAYLLYRNFLAPYWALAASILTALSPHLVNMNIYILSETLYTFLCILTLWLFTRYQQQRKQTILFLTGLALGAATLTRPGMQYFILPMLLMLYLYVPSSTRFRTMAILVLGFVLVIGPWHIRNLVSTGELSNNTLKINFLHHGMYPGFRYHDQAQSTGFPYRFDPNSAKVSKDVPSILHEIERRFTEEPARHLYWYLLGKPVQFWSWNILSGMGDAFVYEVRRSPYFTEQIYKFSHTLMYWIYYPAVVLALIASILVWLPQWAARLGGGTLFTARCFSLILIYFTVLHMIGAPFPRYSIPLRPYLYGMAILSLCILAQMIAAAGKRKSPAE